MKNDPRIPVLTDILPATSEPALDPAASVSEASREDRLLPLIEEVARATAERVLGQLEPLLRTELEAELKRRLGTAMETNTGTAVSELPLGED